MLNSFSANILSELSAVSRSFLFQVLIGIVISCHARRFQPSLVKARQHLSYDVQALFIRGICYNRYPANSHVLFLLRVVRTLVQL